jgi:hypothetical protein
MKSDMEVFYEKLSIHFSSCLDCSITALYMQGALVALHFAFAVHVTPGTFANQGSKIRLCVTYSECQKWKSDATDSPMFSSYPSDSNLTEHNMNGVSFNTVAGIFRGVNTA